MGHWLIVQTNPQQERKAAGEVRLFGLMHGGDFRAFVPKWSQIIVNTRKGETRVKRRPLYAGYIFVRFPEGYYNDLADCQGVRRILKRMDGSPAIVPQKMIAALLRNERNMKHEEEDARIYRMGRRRGAPASFDAAMSLALFAGSSKGLVVAGPWADKEVTITGIAANGLVEAEVVLMGVSSKMLLKPLVEIIPIAERESSDIDQISEAA